MLVPVVELLLPPALRPLEVVLLREGKRPQKTRNQKRKKVCHDSVDLIALCIVMVRGLTRILPCTEKEESDEDMGFGLFD